MQMRTRTLPVLVALAATLVTTGGWSSPAAADGEDVLVIATSYDVYNEDVADGLRATGRFASVTVNKPVADCNDATADPIDASTLEGIESVLVFADCPFQEAAEPVGDLLADFVDDGGTVVVTPFALIPEWGGGLDGRWADERYSALQPVSDAPTLTASRVAAAEASSDMVPLLPEHSLLAGVSSFSGGTYGHRANVKPAPDATLVAEWYDGRPFLAQHHRGIGTVVGANFYPVSSNVHPDFWDADTDGWTILANALSARVPQPQPAPTPTPAEPRPAAAPDPARPAPAPNRPAPAPAPTAKPVVAAPSFTG